MNILVLTPWYPSDEHPVWGIFVRKQSEVLATRHRVSVLHVTGMPLAAYLKSRKFSVSDEEGLRVYRAHYPEIPRLARLCYLYIMLWHFLKIRRAQKVDIIHAHVSLPAGLAAVMLQKIFKIPAALTEHAHYLEEDIRDRRKYRFLKYVWNNVSVLIAVSAPLRDLINGSHDKKKAVVVPNVVDTRFLQSFRKPQPLPEQVTILFLGYMNTDRKGVDYLLRAVAAVKDRAAKPFHVHLYGSGGEMQPVYERMAADLGVADVCTFYGFRQAAEIREVLNACDFLVLPSRSETFAIAVAEAMACGKPVVVTRCGGPEEYVADFAGYVIPPNDGAALEEALLKMIGACRQFDAGRIARHIDGLFGVDAFLRTLEPLFEGATA